MKTKYCNWRLILLIHCVLCFEIFAEKKDAEVKHVPNIKMSKEIKEAGKICQRKNKDSGAQVRIVGGDYAPQKAFPWMAAVYQYGSCEKEGEQTMLTSAGSIISKNYVITCAHSLHGPCKAKDFFVRLGDFDVMSPHDDLQRGVINRKVKKIIIHEQYKGSPSFNNDIALIRLNASVKFTQFIRPICVPGLNVPAWKLKKNDKVMAAGWGATKGAAFSSSFSPQLRFVVLRVADMDLCEYKANQGPKDDNMFFCTGEKSKKIKDTCQGDSGGPIMPFRNNKSPEPYLVGITSHGDNLCEGIAAFHTNVANYAKWIGQKAK